MFGLNPVDVSSDLESNFTPGYGYSNLLGRAEADALPAAVGNEVTQASRKSQTRTNDVSKVCTFSFGIDYTLVYKIGWLSLPTREFGKSPFWKTDLECVKINGVVDLKFTKTIAEFDTTVKDIHVPHGDLAKIHQGLKATYDYRLKKYVFKCCYAKDLEISFKDHKVKLPVEAWTINVDNFGEHCAAKFAASNTIEIPTSRWRLGTDFMENFYTIFDKQGAQTGLGLYHGQNPSYLT